MGERTIFWWIPSKHREIQAYQDDVYRHLENIKIYIKNSFKISKILPNLTLTFAIFGFHILLATTTIITQYFLLARHFKMNKNLKFYFTTTIKPWFSQDELVVLSDHRSKGVLCSSGKRRKNPKLVQLSVSMSVCLFHWAIKSVHSVLFVCLFWGCIKTHKLLQVCKKVVANLFTSCQQVMFELLVPSCWNKFGSSC
jgi:hypothetical protein